MTDDGMDKQQTPNANRGINSGVNRDVSSGVNSGSQPSEQSQQSVKPSQTSEQTSTTAQSATPSTRSANTTINPRADALAATPELRTLWHDALGNLSERQLLRALAATEVSGTLWLERPHHCSLLLLARGRTLVSFELANTEQSHRRVRLFAHPSDETILLPRATSRYPTSHLPLLQALPDLPPEQYLSSASCDLNGLVQEQTEGLLVIETVSAEDKPPHPIKQPVKQPTQPLTQQQRGYALFVAGELRDVSLERWSANHTDGEVLEGSEALTALLELEGHVTVSQWALAPFVSAGLLALRGERRDDSSPFLHATEDLLADDADAVILAQDAAAVTTEVLEQDTTVTELADTENTADAKDTEDTADTQDTDARDTEDDSDAAALKAGANDAGEVPSVLEVSDAGYTFYDGAHACLHVPSTPVLAGGWYHSNSADSIALPDATSHIVKKYYRLTLRGRDALSPMMDVYTVVQKEFGNKGKDILHALREPRSSHALLEVEPDPDVLEDLLRRLVRASLIFELDPNSPDIDLSDVP